MVKDIRGVTCTLRPYKNKLGQGYDVYHGNIVSNYDGAIIEDHDGFHIDRAGGNPDIFAPTGPFQTLDEAVEKMVFGEGA